MSEPIFLTLEQVLYLQNFEACLTGSPTLICNQGALVFLSINGFIENESRDEELARTCIGLPQQSGN